MDFVSILEEQNATLVNPRTTINMCWTNIEQDKTCRLCLHNQKQN